MKIGIQTWGSDGDIRPFCALAGGLAKAGHHVTLVVTSVDQKDYSALASAMGFEIRHVHGEVHLAEKELKELFLGVERSGNIAKHLKILCRETLDPVTDIMYEAALRLAEENDALISHLVCHTMMTAAEKTGCPYVVVSPAPTHLANCHFPPVGMPNLGATGNRLFWKASGIGINHIFKKSVNTLRKKVGVAPVKNVLNELWISDRLNIIAASPSIVRHAPDWNKTVRVVGFFDVPSQAEQWVMPDDLKQFLEAGEPPVYLTFGSFNAIDIDNNARLLTEAAKLGGKRAIIQTYWDQATFRPEDPNCFLIDKTPHHKIFPHCSAIVHHGGAGTTHSSVYCGLALRGCRPRF